MHSREVLWPTDLIDVVSSFGQMPRQGKSIELRMSVVYTQHCSTQMAFFPPLSE